MYEGSQECHTEHFKSERWDGGCGERSNAHETLQSDPKQADRASSVMTLCVINLICE